MFTGNGLITYANNVFNGETIEMNCTTYNDCYYLLCSYLFQPMYLIRVQPQIWNGSCSNLYKDDNRKLDTELYLYHNKTPIGMNTTKTISDLSISLCKLNQNKFITKIYYFPDDCDLTTS